MTTFVNASSRQIASTHARTAGHSMARRARNSLLLATGAALALSGLGAVGAPVAQAAATDPSTGFIYTDNGSVVTITGCDATCTNQPVTIPSTINGMPVTKVATDSWTQTGRITSLTIPNSVTEFGGYLAGKSITSVVFAPGSPLTTIGELAFRSMDGLTSVTLPENLTTIPTSAFRYTTSLTSIVLPNTITTIERDAFRDTGIGTVNMPTSLVTIGDQAFQNTTLGSVVLPAGVTTIGYRAFQGARISSLTLNENLVTIGTEAFQANQITSLTLPSTLRR